MKQRNGNRIVIAFIILQTIGTIVLALFAINLLFDPNSKFNQNVKDQIQSVIAGVPRTIIRETGAPGQDGQPGIAGERGEKGDRGDKGDTGDTGVNGSDGASVVGEKGEQGEQGLPGAQGPQGERAEFRCNPDTRVREYKYPSDEDWTSEGSYCIPVSGGNRDVQ